MQPGEEAIGVRLRPGAFTALYGVPADELTDVRVPLADVVRAPPLLDAARDADRPDPLAAVAMATPDVTALARESGYSARHLRRRVLAATGHSPRKLARIGRMQALLAAGRGESWARTAVQFGYYDEAHMINDVRALADATPQMLLAERAAAGATARDVTARRWIGVVVAVLGAIVLIGSFVWRSAVVPALVRYPTDLDVTPQYAGTVTLYIDPSTHLPLSEPTTFDLERRPPPRRRRRGELDRTGSSSRRTSTWWPPGCSTSPSSTST